MPHTILLADADRPGLQAIAAGLREAGYVVVLAADADEALARVREGAPDLVCLDVNLPHDGGFQVFPRIKAAKPVPVIWMLERLDDRISAGIAAAGAEDLLFKPLDVIEVIDKAAWYLEPEA